jgi:MFS family permease
MAPPSVPLVPLIPHAGTGSSIRNIWLLTLGFFFLFAAYNTLQGYVTTTLKGNLGYESLAILYICYEVFLLLAPAICNRIGDRAAMTIGAMCYAIYIGSLMLGNQLGTESHPILIKITVYLASALIGFGAAILWVGQGSYITECCTGSRRGQQAGIFWGGMQLASVVGPLLSYNVLFLVRSERPPLLRAAPPPAPVLRAMCRVPCATDHVFPLKRTLRRGADVRCQGQPRRRDRQSPSRRPHHVRIIMAE